MIHDIKELNFPSYATLSNATVTESHMGERTITTQVKIDGNITPSFVDEKGEPWAVEFKGEKYVLTVRTPQATKENTSLNSVIDLTFYHWAEYELKRYFFFEFTSEESGTAIADKYIASMSVNLGDFVDAFKKLLNYYYGDKITAELNPDWVYSTDRSFVDISYSYIWNVLIELYEIYEVTWQIVSDGDKCVILIGYSTEQLDHVFQYGFEGGLLKVERQVQDDNIRNILLGRGSEENLPYRYFKNVDPNNPSFPADPDWIPELANITFDGLRDAGFRSYVQGWKFRKYNGTVTKNLSAVDWAWQKGYDDAGTGKFLPVEYVKDDASIEKYGELWGGLDKNDDIKPTIQGMVLNGIGRADEIVAIEQIEDDEEKDDSVTLSIAKQVETNLASMPIPGEGYTGTNEFPFTVPEGFFGNIQIDGLHLSNANCTKWQSLIQAMLDEWIKNQHLSQEEAEKKAELLYDGLLAEFRNNTDVTETQIVVRKKDSDETIPSVGIPAGEYLVKIILTVTSSYVMNGANEIFFSYTIPELSVYCSQIVPSYSVFSVWIKNIWQTSKKSDETDEEYTKRVWSPILGDHLGNDAALMFSDGRLAFNEDYEFRMISPLTEYISYDTSKELNGVHSHWKLTLQKSSAELDTLGKLIPNSTLNGSAGDHFYFVGIDLPYLYYTEAEKRLTEYKMKQLYNVSDIKPTWVVSLDKVRIANKQENEVTELINLLKAGASIHLADKRFITDDVEEDGHIPTETLYLTSITYTYSEPTKDSPNIIPDVTVVLSDKLATTANTVSEIQSDIESLKQTVCGLSDANWMFYLTNAGINLLKPFARLFFNKSGRSVYIDRIVNTIGNTINDFSSWASDTAIATTNSIKSYVSAVMQTIENKFLRKDRPDETTFKLGMGSAEVKRDATIGGDALIDGTLARSKTVLDDVEYRAIVEALVNYIHSDNYTGDGAFDTGWMFTNKDANGHSYAVVDNLFVRMKAIFTELEIRKLSYAGGNLVFSHAGSKIEAVITLANGNYRCYIKKDDGTTSTENWWRENDLARCQTFNVESGTSYNVENTYYWRRVVATGTEIPAGGNEEFDYVDLSATDCDGTDIPKAEDSIVQMGNRTDTTRQGFITIEVWSNDGSAPAIKVYNGVGNGGFGDFSLEGKRKILISPKDTDLTVNRLHIETAYGAVRVPTEMGDWDDIPEHKCYYYFLVQHKGATWLCIYPENGINGVLYTTEEPSDNAVYWTPYARGTKGEDGKDGTSYELRASTNVVNGKPVGSPTPNTITFSAFVNQGGEQKPYMGFIVIEDVFNFLLFANYASTATISSAEATFPVTAKLYKSESGGEPIATSTVVLVQDGSKGEDGTDAINVYLSPANLILNQDTSYPYGIPLTNAFAEVKVYKGTTDVSGSATITSVSGTNCGANFSGKTVRITSISSSGGKYYDNGYVTVNVSYGGAMYSLRLNWYANLLGTWSQSVVADTETAVAQKLSYGYDESGGVRSLEQIGSYIRSSEKNVSTLRQDVNGVLTAQSEIRQTVDKISLNVLAPNSVSRENRITSTGNVNFKDSGTIPTLTTNAYGQYMYMVLPISAFNSNGDFTLTIRISNPSKSYTITMQISPDVQPIITTSGSGIFVECTVYSKTTTQGRTILTIYADYGSSVNHASTTVTLTAVRATGGAFENNTAVNSYLTIDNKRYDRVLYVSDDINLKNLVQLYATGIDIEKGKITLTADNFLVRNNAGETTASIDANGNLAIGGVFNNLIQTITDDNCEKYGVRVDSTTFWLNPLSVGSVIIWDAPSLYSVVLPTAIYKNGTMLDGYVLDPTNPSGAAIYALRRCLGKKFYIYAPSGNYAKFTSNNYLLCQKFTTYEYNGSYDDFSHIISDAESSGTGMSSDYTATEKVRFRYQIFYTGTSVDRLYVFECKAGLVNNRECIYWEVTDCGQALY